VLPRYLDSDLREAARFGTLLGARRVLARANQSRELSAVDRVTRRVVD
jgi:hypothetical protein